MTRLLLAAALCAGIAAAQGPTISFASFGRPCGANLAGSQARTATQTVARFDVTGAAPNSFCVLAMGHQDRPITLPGSNCLLLVQPRATVLQAVDGNGATAYRFAVPPIVPLSVDFQAVTIALSRNGRTAESSNGVTLNQR